MKNNCILTIFFLLGFSVNASDYLTTAKQMKEMDDAFMNLPVISSNEEILDEDEESPDSTQTLNDIFGTNLAMQPAEKDKDKVLRLYLPDNKSETSAFTSKEVQKHKKMSSEIIFHSLNDSLNFLLTTQQIISDSMLKDPKLFRFTLYLTSISDKLDFPLNNFPSPLADFTQGALNLASLQYWIDIFALFKNTIFCGFQNSFDHNSAVLIKKSVPIYIKMLEDRPKYLKSMPAMSHLENKEAVFLESAVNNFYPLLLDCLKNLYNTLPNEMIFEIHSSTKKGISKKTKNLRERKENEINKTSERLSENLMSHKTIYDNFLDILKIIRSRELFEAMEKSLTEHQIRNLVITEPFYKTMHNMYTRRSNDGYAIFFPEIGVLMIKWQKNRTDFQLPGKLFNGIKWSELLSLAFAKTYPDLNKVSSFEVQETQEIKEEKVEKEEELEEENFYFNKEYFTEQHAYHQQRKNQAHMQNIEVPAVLSDYEIELFNFIQNNIYNCKNKQTWNQLVKGLSDLGFKGKANTFGNGSTWVFSVNEKNKLFFKDKKYKNATFNVHKFSGNGAIHPQYLKFFQSGLANVFGLSKDYIESLQ